MDESIEQRQISLRLTVIVGESVIDARVRCSIVDVSSTGDDKTARKFVVVLRRGASDRLHVDIVFVLIAEVAFTFIVVGCAGFDYWSTSSRPPEVDTGGSEQQVAGNRRRGDRCRRRRWKE